MEQVPKVRYFLIGKKTPNNRLFNSFTVSFPEEVNDGLYIFFRWKIENWVGPLVPVINIESMRPQWIVATNGIDGLKIPFIERITDRGKETDFRVVFENVFPGIRTGNITEGRVSCHDNG